MKSTNTTKLNLHPLQTFLKADSNIVFAVLFGSAKDGLLKEGSDLDIGVLFDNAPKNSIEEFSYYSKLCNCIPMVEKVDLVVLNRANTVLAFEALKGNYIQKNNPEKTAEFYSLTCREYEDKMAWFNKQKQYRTK